jgi:glycyl-tRNA synthetase beta chain
MENKNFLLEIGVEELPARHCQSILSQLNENLMNSLPREHNLKFTNLEILISPRRIVFLADKLSQLNQTQDIKGPIYRVGFDENDEPTKVAHKFAESHGKSVEDIKIRKENGKKFLYVTKNLSEQFHRQIQDFISNTIEQLHFDRAMKWDASGLEFSRPIRWIVCLIEDKLVDIKLGNVSSARVSYGNRFDLTPEIKIPHAKDYLKIMRTNFVEPKQSVRQDIIKKALDALHKKDLAPQKSKVTQDLIKEVTYLIEWPQPILCSFEKEFLKIPKEIITSVLSKHQRYFPLFNEKDATISNKFMVIANYNKASEIIKSGNEKVVRARLSDAAFFFKQDLKHDLDFFRKKTRTITFQEKLGSMLEKSKRLINLAPKIAKELNLELNEDLIKKAAKYCKSDLSTTMVTEFTSLEGTVGRIYAQEQGFNSAVAKAIQEHYLPRYSQDSLPSCDLGLILSISDKIDTLYGMFSIDIEPKGNSDPYGLRRAGIALTRMLWEKELEIELDQLIKYAAENFDTEADLVNLRNFNLSRLEQTLKESDIIEDTNLLRAAVYASSSSIKVKKSVIGELKELTDTEKLDDLIEIIKRIYNIAIKKKKEFSEVDINKTELNKSEKELYNIVAELEKEEVPTINRLLTIIKPTHDFFENNMVMSKKEDEKERRLTLLTRLYNQINKVLEAEYLFQ